MLKRHTPLKRSAAPLKRSPIRRVSKKRAKQNREYSKLRLQFLKEHPICQVWLKECGWVEVPGPVSTRYANAQDRKMHSAEHLFNFKGAPYATEVHHKNKRHGSRLNETRDWLAVCRYNHQRIEDNLAWARAEGFSMPI